MSRNNKIVHVIGATAAGGAESFVIDLSIALREAGHNVSVYALSSRLDSVGAKQRFSLAQAGVKFDSGPTEKVGIRSILAYTKYMNRNKPQLVHLHTQNTEFLNAISKMISRVDYSVARTIHSTHLNLGLRYRWAYRKNACCISIACSEAVADKQNLVLGDVEVIANGKSFSWPVKTDQNTLEMKKQLGLDPHKRHYISVGRMDGSSLETSPKSHNTMIDAWKKSSLAREGGCLHLLGDGPLRDKLEDLAKGEPSIVFEGISDRVTDWLLACDVFLLPSRYEGLPIVGIEAVGTGIYVIFSEIPPLRLLEPARVIWVPVDDAQSLSNAINKSIQSEEQLNSEDVLIQRERFGISSVVGKYLSYYDRLLATAKREISRGAV